MFTLNELEIGFLEALNISAGTDELFDEVSKEPLSLIKGNEGQGALIGRENYIYGCGSITVMIDIDKDNTVGTHKTITVIKGNMKYLLDIIDRDCYDSQRVRVSIESKENNYLERETIALCFSPITIEDDDYDKDFLTVSLKNPKYDGVDTASIKCSQTRIIMRKNDCETPMRYSDILTSENYESYLNLLIYSIRNSVIRDEFVPFIQFFQSIAPLSLINRKVMEIRAKYKKAIDSLNNKSQKKLERNVGAKPRFINNLNDKRKRKVEKIEDERDIIIEKYEEIKEVFKSSKQKNGTQVRVYRTDTFEQ